MKTLLLLSLFALSPFAQARTVYADHYTEINTRYLINQPSDCVYEYLTPVSQTIQSAGVCRMTQALRLTTADHDFPNLSMNPRRVEVWEGAFAKNSVTSTNYLRELVDTCRGRILSHFYKVESETHSEVFSVRNPNLDDSISESFMTVPMTEAEAAREMKETLRRCQQ